MVESKERVSLLSAFQGAEVCSGAVFCCHCMQSNMKGGLTGSHAAN